MPAVDEIILAPSILSADFAAMGEAARAAEEAGAEYLHIDIMDAHFVPNLTFGWSMVKALRPHSEAFYDVHLMIDQPDLYIADFVEAGADGVTVPAEACLHLQRTLTKLRDLGVRVGVALNPHTPLNCLEYVLDQIDLINVMTVNPGFGGQAFIPAMLPKIAAARELAQRAPRPILIEIDGGATIETVGDAVAHGANVIVAGSSFYGWPQGTKDAARVLRESAEAVRRV